MKIKTDFMRQIIIMASNKKEAMKIALENYGTTCAYVKPYRYASKGNNFYEFKMPEVIEIFE